MAYTQFNGWNIIPMPASPAPRSMTFSMNDSVGQTQSPFTMQAQVQAWPGADWWEVEVSLPPMNRARAAAWVSWLMAMRGKSNVARIGDPLSLAPRGLATASAAISGAQLATATTISTKGWTPASANRNLIPDPDILSASAWPGNPLPLSVGIGMGSIPGTNGLYVVGTGSATGQGGGFWYSYSPAIAVTAGAQYTMSGYVDSSAVTSGPAGGWAVYSSNIQTFVGSASSPIGSKGRFSGTMTIPAGITQVVVLAQTNNCVVSRGGMMSFSNPQFEAGATQTSYVGTQAALMSGDYLQLGNRLHCVAGPSAVVPDASGNATFEIWPSVREALTDGQSINLMAPTGLFRLADNKRSWSVNEAKMYGISFKLVEAR